MNSLGYKVFDGVEEHLNAKHPDERFYIHAARGASGTGVSVSDGLAVPKGSVVADPVSASISPSIVKLRNKLIAQNVIDDSHVFTKDHIFTSPSLAAAMVMGRNANGRIEWKTKNGKTLKDLEVGKEI